MFGPGNKKKNVRTVSKKQENAPKKEPAAPLNRKRVQKVIKEKQAKRRASLRPKLPAAKRVVKAVVRLMFASAVTGAVLLLGFLTYQHAVSSDYFALRELTLTGNHRLTKEEIASTAGLILEKNIFKIDLAGAERALEAHPWITDATIARRLPGQISVQVVEREAVAMVNLDVLYLVDDMGKVFKRWVRGDPLPSPVITGVSREHYLENPTQVEMILCDAIDLANRYNGGPLAKAAPLDEIHREADGGFALTVGEDPVYVKFGRGPYRTKLERLAVLMGRLTREGKRPGTIYFDNEVRPDRITVKLKSEKKRWDQSGRNIVESDAKKMMSKI